MNHSRALIRVMTANLLEDGADPDSLAQLIDALDPDLVFFQEMSAGPITVIHERFEYHHLVPGAGPMGRGVASKHEAELGSLDLPWRPGTYARLSRGGRSLTAAGVHMPNPIVFPWWRAVRERRDQTKALVLWAGREESDSLVIAGDMNASPAWPMYRRLAELLDDLPQQCATRAGVKPERTWGWRPGWPRMLRIDHVFGRGVKAVAASVHPIQGSDHHAVVVDFSLE